jgi:uncharacterized Rossmann fold enzyme
MKKKVHIVVKDGLVQVVYAEGVDVEVVVYDLDTDDNEEYDELSEAVGKLPDIAYRVY